MGFFEKHKIKIIFSAIVAVSLVLAFLWNGDAPRTHENDISVTVTERPKKQKKTKRPSDSRTRSVSGKPCG